jgi:hypothetical protein
MTIKITSIQTRYLKETQIQKIIFLKNTQWKFGIKSQKKWFRNNVKPNDMHSLLYYKSILIGYTLLRKRSFFEKNSLKKKMNYILFDTIIIKKNYRKKNFASMLMKFNNKIIKKSNLVSILICKKKLVNFYKKHKWDELKRQKIFIKDFMTEKYILTYNNNLKLNRLYYFCFDK